MNKTIIILLLLVASLTGKAEQPVQVYLPQPAHDASKFAADELSSYLSKMSGYDIKVTDENKGPVIALYTLPQLPNSLKLNDLPTQAEAFVIKTVQVDDNRQIAICGFDQRGLLYGVYELVELYMSKVLKSDHVDISFDMEKGIGKDYNILAMDIDIQKTPFYKNRGIHLDFISLGTAAMLGIDNSQPKDKEVWKRWCTWGARHRLNYITNWPYGKTNWWELVPDSVLSGATNFSDKQLSEGIAIRQDLLKYANDCSIDPYLMNYVPGKGSKEMVEKYPNLFTRNEEKHVARFCYNQPELWDMFYAVITSIPVQYPQMKGYNLRRWGESYPCECEFCKGRDDELSRELLVNMIKKTKEERNDLKIILSGYADPQYASHFPDYVTCMIKWGNDWDPSPDPGLSPDYLRQYNKKDVIIDIALPCEESFPLGLIEHTYLNEGILKYAKNSQDYPNLTGFCAGLGDSETIFLTELNYIVFSKLVRDPENFNLNEFVKAYLVNKFGAGAADNIQQSLDIQADVWNRFFCSTSRGGYEFLFLAPYSNWARFGDLYTSFPAGGKKAYEWIMTRDTATLNLSYQRIVELHKKQDQAFRLVEKCKASIPKRNKLMYTDYLLQTKAYLLYLKSRQAFVEAMLAKNQNRNDIYISKIQSVIKFNTQLRQTVKDKPNNVGYGDQGGNIADWELKRFLEGIDDENKYLRSL
jgi:hypothetical protein